MRSPLFAAEASSFLSHTGRRPLRMERNEMDMNRPFELSLERQNEMIEQLKSEVSNAQMIIYFWTLSVKQRVN
jgi:hypothetical protein